MVEQVRLFGTELRSRRLAAGLSLANLSSLVHYSKGYLSKIETGLKPPGTDLARRCDAELGAGGQLAALVPRRPDRVTGPTDPGDSEVWIMLLDPDGAIQFAPVSRRRALTMGGTGLLAIGLAGAGSSATAQDEATVVHFRSLLEKIRELGRTASPSVVLPSLVTHTQTLRGLAGAAPEPARTRLLLLAGRYAEYAGWMAQEAGHDRLASWWTRMAVRLASEAADHELVSYALVRQANLALYREDGIATVALAAQAVHDRRLSARVRGLAAHREAQGHALGGDDYRCRMSLDQAAEFLARPSQERAEPILGSNSVPDPTALVTGWCLHDLGRPGQAADVLDREVPRMPHTARRAAARFGARRALAHAADAEIDYACALTGEVLDLVELTDSATIRYDLRRLARTLARWHRDPAVRRLQPRLAAASRPAAIGSDW